MRLHRVFSIVMLIALTAFPASAGVVTFTLDPVNGAIAGDAGQTVGWGLNIWNDTEQWLVIASTTFDQTTSIGNFADFLTPQFLSYAVAPGGTWTQAFNAATFAGLGSYVIDGSFALPGDVAAGNLHIWYDLHTADPNAQGYDPFSDTVTGADILMQASVTYQQTPEPVSCVTALAGLVLLGLTQAARRRGDTLR
jgi:hypothetical protein